MFSSTKIIFKTHLKSHKVRDYLKAYYKVTVIKMVSF